MRTLFFSVLFMAGAMLCQTAIANGAKAGQYAGPYYGKHPSPKQVILYPGSLKTNVENIARQYGWNRVIWDSPNDYHWVAYTKIRQTRVQDVMRVVLVNYPLKAVFYEGNHVLVIKPRTKR